MGAQYDYSLDPWIFGVVLLFALLITLIAILAGRWLTKG